MDSSLTIGKMISTQQGLDQAVEAPSRTRSVKGRETKGTVKNSCHRYIATMHRYVKAFDRALSRPDGKPGMPSPSQLKRDCRGFENIELDFACG